VGLGSDKKSACIGESSTRAGISCGNGHLQGLKPVFIAWLSSTTEVVP
jgi:hypothetical protein